MPFYKAVGLSKLKAVVIDGDFCELSRLFLITAADINSIDNVAIRPDQIGAVLFHRSIKRPKKEDGLTSPHSADR